MEDSFVHTCTLAINLSLRVTTINTTIATIDDKLNIYYDEKIVHGLDKKISDISQVAFDLKKEKAAHKVVPKKIAIDPKQNIQVAKHKTFLKEDNRESQEQKQRKTGNRKR